MERTLRRPHPTALALVSWTSGPTLLSQTKQNTIWKYIINLNKYASLYAVAGGSAPPEPEIANSLALSTTKAAGAPTDLAPSTADASQNGNGDTTASFDTETAATAASDMLQSLMSTIGSQKTKIYRI